MIYRVIVIAVLSIAALIYADSSIVFQQGVNGYNGCKDKFLLVDKPRIASHYKKIISPDSPQLGVSHYIC